MKLLSWINNYYPEYKIIVLNMKLLSAECESESECDGNFFVAIEGVHGHVIFANKLCVQIAYHSKVIVLTAENVDIIIDF